MGSGKVFQSRSKGGGKGIGEGRSDKGGGILVSHNTSFSDEDCEDCEDCNGLNQYVLQEGETQEQSCHVQ